MSKNVIRPVKGTTDFYPEDMKIRTWLYSKLRQVSETFGYEEYEGPFLEKIDLYAAKSGEELVKKQSYSFKDRSGEFITLRPELTPTLARMVAQKQGQLVFPLKWWSFGPFWRYERPQKGRSREFFQWNIDMIGPRSPEGDAELIAIAAEFLKAVGLSSQQTKILVNDREFMDAKIAEIGISDDIRKEAFRWIDRKDKLSADAWKSYGAEIGITEEQISAIESLISDQDIWHESESLTRVFAAVEKFGVSEYVQFAPHIIRGLDYYTGTVFEAWDTAGEHRAIFGGGRYDNLVEDVGGQQVSAVGFAVGNVVISLLLEELGLLPELPDTTAAVLVTNFNEELQAASISLSTLLRSAGIPVMNYPTADKLGKQFKFANRKGIPIAVILGPDEAAQNQAAVKDMQTGEQVVLDQSALVNHVKNLL